MIKLAVAEDNPLLAETIKEKLSFYDDQFKLKHLAINGKAMVDYLENDTNLDVILMDIEMPIMNGIKATEIIKQYYPHVKIIMLTVFDDEQNIFNAIKAGADGYLLKDERPNVIKNSILEILEGGAPMSPSIANKALKLLRNPSFLETTENSKDYELTKREIDVLEQLCVGLEYKKIAEHLNISPNTVRKHIENIYSKLHVHNKVEAIQLATKERLV